MRINFLIFVFIIIPNFCVLAEEPSSAKDISQQNTSLTDPVLTDDALMKWVEKAVTDTLTFDFSNYNERLNHSAQYFTYEGFTKFMEALNSARIIEYIKERKQLLTTSISASPVIIEKGIGETTTKPSTDNPFSFFWFLWHYWDGVPYNTHSETYFWRIELPINLTYIMGEKQRTDHLIVTLIIERSNEINNPDGIGITQWLAIRANK